MSEIALYRRWRPQTFGDVVGQEHVEKTLQGQVAEGRIAHAYLFSGPRGTGKTSSARILAKALNCEQGPTPEPCNKCDACVSITDGTSLDVIEIDAASHGGVDDVRDLRENVLLAPAIARKKVYIVDEAHMVTTQGWNAFLKTIEEPPAHVVFVFATTEPDKVVSTIKSRCQRFDFRRISAEAIGTHLARVCREEKIEADEAALAILARHADGSARDALAALDQLASSGAVTADRALGLLGTAPTETLFELADAFASRDAGAALKIIGRVVDEGRDLRVLTRQALEHFRALLFVKQVPEGGTLVDATEETRVRLEAQATRFAPAQLVHALRLLADAQAEMRQQAPPRMTLELAIVRAAMPEADTGVEAALARIERLERLLDVAGPPAAAPEPAPQAETPAPTEREARRAKRTAAPPPPVVEEQRIPPPAGVDTEKVIRDWPVVLEEVRKASRNVRALLNDVRPVSFENGSLTLEARYAFHAAQLTAEKAANILGGAFRVVFGGTPRIATLVSENAPEPAPTADEPAEPVDPLEALKAGLGAEVIEQRTEPAETPDKAE
jgi:DNA polymerase III subunit gamma/tau